ncbi:MAG: histidine phosphatase family protein [Ignavibacteriales bacterium]|jgi:Phosphohistidine phosphatase SixA|nr:MAG: hypothetical protein F9K26_00275 [Ignavibacteriaceae bacterium]MBW7871847.1 histidine phosphatase family protein [Ignavibacteria bacterium]MCZ2144303.1 histidine phosphatase family protein [Ignavibacteriales bacterium]OQY73128.1 MAG: hypothetical protein B6D45_08355 [Ignavibacteriales bacterium UTCHB3]MBV6446256.1 hypothetical protein [Ignavibacteriaceae bacterium]
MNLYIIRHSEAEYIGTGANGDRQLTPEGRNLIRESAKRWFSFTTVPSLILSSPALRTIQTMDEIVAALNYTGEKSITNDLKSGSSIGGIFSMLREFDSDSIMLIMHEPETSLLLGESCGFRDVNLYFKPGTIAKVVFPAKPRAGAGKLHFFLPPEVFAQKS